MATWGYRVYTFKLVAGREQLSQEIEAHRERLLEVLDAVGQKTRVGAPRHAAAEIDATESDELEDVSNQEYEKTQPTLTIRGSAYDADLSAIHSNIALGEQGLHDYAINPDDGSDRVDVKARSAETPRRTDFYFASAGFEGFLVTEVVGMKDPVPMLVKWIRRTSLDARNRRLDEISAEYEKPDPTGERISKTQAKANVPKALRVQVDRVADPELLNRILNDIKSMDAEYVTLDENNRETDKRLIIKVRDKRAQGSIVKLLTGDTDGDAVIKQTLKELDMDDSELRDANIQPDGVKVHVRSSDGNTTLAPGKLSELFNYRFDSAGRPNNASYYSITLGKIDHLKGPSQVPMAVPESSAVTEWVQREEGAWLPQQEVSNA